MEVKIQQLTVSPKIQLKGYITWTWDLSNCNSNLKKTILILKFFLEHQKLPMLIFES